MSEYQYYEFLAIDRPLTAAQVTAVRQVSSRADISASRFVNEYQYGDFKGDVDQFLRDYYDCHVNVTNWGTRRFAFRLPVDLIDRSAVKAYAHPESLEVRPAGADAVIVDIDPRDDSGDWDYPEDSARWMGSLANLRAEVLGGDLRPLYLGWLAGVALLGFEKHDEDDEDDGPSPPVPPGLGKLSAAQRTLAEYVRLPDELLETAAADSPPSAPPADLAAAVRSAPVAQKDAWLLDVLGGGDPLAVARVRRQLLAHAGPVPAATVGRTVGQLRRAWWELDDRRTRERSAAMAKARRKREAAEASARDRRLSDLSARGTDAAWRDVDLFVAQKNRDGYDKAVALLKDLRAVADRAGGDPADFAERCRALLRANSRRSSFTAAVRAAGLGTA